MNIKKTSEILFGTHKVELSLLDDIKSMMKEYANQLNAASSIVEKAYFAYEKANKTAKEANSLAVKALAKAKELGIDTKEFETAVKYSSEDVKRSQQLLDAFDNF